MYASHGVPLVRSKNCHVFRDVAILMWLWWVEFSEKCCYCSAQKILNLVKEVNLTFKRGVCLNLFSRKLRVFQDQIKILISKSFSPANVVFVSYFIKSCGILFVYGCVGPTRHHCWMKRVWENISENWNRPIIGLRVRVWS